MTKPETLHTLDGPYLLPEGIRVCDIKGLDVEERDIMLLLAMEGRKTRYYFMARGNLNIIKKLKSKGFVCAIKMNNNYAYDLSPIGLILMKKGFI